MNAKLTGSLSPATSPPSNVQIHLDLLSSAQDTTEKLIPQLGDFLAPVLSEDHPNPISDTALPGVHCLISSRLSDRVSHTMNLNGMLETLISRLAI